MNNLVAVLVLFFIFVIALVCSPFVAVFFAIHSFYEAEEHRGAKTETIEDDRNK